MDKDKLNAYCTHPGRELTHLAERSPLWQGLNKVEREHVVRLEFEAVRDPRISLSVGWIVMTESCDQTLVIQRGDTGIIANPAGRMEWDETIHMAAMREWYEETGSHPFVIENYWPQDVFGIYNKVKNKLSIGVVIAGTLSPQFERFNFKPRDPDNETDACFLIPTDNVVYGCGYGSPIFGSSLLKKTIPEIAMRRDATFESGIGFAERLITVVDAIDSFQDGKLEYPDISDTVYPGTPHPAIFAINN